jgi:hypothetical protein
MKMSASDKLSELENILCGKTLEETLQKDRIIGFMSSDEIEVLGAVFSLIHKEKFYRRILPALAFAEYREFNLKYYKRCLIEDPKGAWVMSRHEAGWSFVSWFRALLKDPTVPKDAIIELKTLVEELWIAGDEEVRAALITSVLEHLFEDEAVRTLFSDWKENATLSGVYREAVEYSMDLKRSRPL